MMFIEYNGGVCRTACCALKAGLLASAGSAALILCGSAHAQNVTWQGTIDNDWTNGANWSGGQAPGSTNTFVFVSPSAATPSPVIDNVAAEAPNLFLGSVDGAELVIRNGGVLNAGSTVISNRTNNSAAPGILDETGTLTVTGNESALNTTDLTVGFYGEGRLNIADGGQAVVTNSISLATFAGSSGVIDISGPDSTLQSNGLMIGTAGAGEVTLTGGGAIVMTGNAGISVGYATGSSGTLNIGAAAGQAAAAAGTITAPRLQFGQGTGRLVLNHTDTAFTLGADIVGNGSIDVLAGRSIFTGVSNTYSGALTISGGTLVLAGTTSAASTMIGSDGTLQIGNGGAAGSLNSDIVNDGNLVFNRAGALTHNRAISGGGDLTVAGGVITLSGMNTFTGATTIDAGASLALTGQGRVNQSSGVTVNGTFDVTAAASAQIKDLGGSGSVIVGSAGLQVTNATQVFSGSISGIGGLNVTGGTLTLTGANTFENGLGINNGAAVNIGNGGASGSIASNITNFGLVTFDRSDVSSYSGVITGAGQIAKAGSGLVRMTGSVAGSSLLVQAGTLELAGAVRGNAAISAGATLVFDRATDATYTGVVSGAGQLTKTGDATLTLTGNSDGFTGSTGIDAGTLLLTGALGGDVTIGSGGALQVGNGSTSGNLAADVENNGSLIFHQAADYDFAGALSGQGNLVKRGSGLLLLSGDYTYTGTTVVEGGIVRLTAELDSESALEVNGGTFDLGNRDQEVAGLSGSGGTLALGTGELTVTQQGDSSFGGGITGTGGFVKAGEGTLNLTGTSSFSGQANVNGGRLTVNGVLPGAITVNDGGTLGGTGTTGGLVINSGGTLAPGNSIGTLNVVGAVTFMAGSTYEVEVNAAGLSDRVNASGAATIDGAMVSVLAAAGNYRWTSDYIILSAAGGINGRFSDTPDVDLPFLSPYLRYEGNDVILSLVRNDRSFASVADTANQRAVALALDASPRNHALYRTVAGQVDEFGAVGAFDTLSGELWATTGTFLVDRTRRFGETVLGRLEQADVVSQSLAKANGASARTAGGRTAIWGQAIGSWNKVASDGNAARATQKTFGFVTGIDTSLGDWRIGVAFGHTEDKIEVAGGAGRATARGSSVSVYAGGGWGALRARLGASYGWLSINGNRKVIFPSVAEDVSGHFHGRTHSAFGELSYGLELGSALVEPFAGVNHVHLGTDAFGESGGPLTALSVAKTSRDVTYTTLGLRVGAALPVSSQTVITPRLSAAWLHGLGDIAALGRHTLQTGQSFSIEGLAATRNALRLEAGVQANILPGGSLGVSYVGNLADRWKDHGLKLGFSYSF